MILSLIVNLKFIAKDREKAEFFLKDIFISIWYVVRINPI